MQIDFDNPLLIEGAVTFPAWNFGGVPAAGGGSPGVGGPLREVVTIVGTTADTPFPAGGEIDKEE